MAKFVEMDDRVTLSTQMEQIVGPVILINKIGVNPNNIDQFLEAWGKDATIMKQQPGFISAQLYRGIAGSCTFINYAVWESSEHYKKAFNRPTNPSLSTLMDFPADTVSPHLFRKVAVLGICVD
jgi:quinol monooxygenase YgiN